MNCVLPRDKLNERVCVPTTGHTAVCPQLLCAKVIPNDVYSIYGTLA